MAQEARQAPSAEMQAMHAARAKQRLDDLSIVLRLRPDQQASLAAFVAAVHPPRGPRAARMGPPPQAMTTPERLDAMARRESEMAARRQQNVAALRAFYATLDPEQRRVFDALQRLHGPGRMGGMHGMHEMHGMHSGDGPGPDGPPHY